jgi:hypothetical protein
LARPKHIMEYNELLWKRTIKTLSQLSLHTSIHMNTSTSVPQKKYPQLMSIHASCNRTLNPGLQVRAMVFERQDTRVSDILYTIYKNDNKNAGQRFWRGPPITVPITCLSWISQDRYYHGWNWLTPGIALILGVCFQVLSVVGCRTPQRYGLRIQNPTVLMWATSRKILCKILRWRWVWHGIGVAGNYAIRMIGWRYIKLKHFGAHSRAQHRTWKQI